MKKHYDNNLLSDIKNYITSGFYDVAEEKIEEYKILFPDDIIICKYQAQLLLKQGFYEEAEKVCSEVLNRSFHVKRLKSDMYITLSEIYHAQGKLEEAIEALETAYELKEVNTQTIQIRLANLYAKINNKIKAMEILDKKESNFFNKNVDLQKAYIYLQEKELDKALKILLDISDNDLKTKIDIQRKNIYLGEIYRKKRDLESSLHYYSKALLVKNDYYWKAYLAIGQIKYKMGYINDAIKVLDEISKKQKQDIVLETLIYCYLIKGDTDNAFKSISEINDPYIKKLFLGRLEYSKQNFESAESILSELINDSTYFDTRYYNYVYYYLMVTKVRLKKYEEALDLINNKSKSICFEDRFKRELSLMKYYVQRNLGFNIKPTSYSERQINYYSDELAINHIKNHHESDYITEYAVSKFNSNVDVEKLYYYIIDNIDTDKRIIYGFLDKYTIDFPEDMGNINDRNLRSVSVVCLPDTKKVITMYPDRFEQIVEDNKTYNKPKVRRLSQIEKFNKKYNK